ncbi:MAG: type IV toxin-antitoxin system AbiEi family antitoxin domain-containing protein [Syntrophaceae bacterium]|nr:type IV toxin-antitoxin system AbiEi family antitoxin domain-containing protein [Syntrophaceae bacterium]
MKLNEFMAQHAVFILDELDRFLSARGSGNPNARKSLLTYYRKQGWIIPIRRGLYATVPASGDSRSSPVDLYLVAAKLTPDAVLAYHTALEFHGKAYSVHTRLHYLSANKSMPLTFQGHKFIRAQMPPTLVTKGEEMFGVIRRNRSGIDLRVTSLERTLVNVLDRPDLASGWEEIWRSLESIEFFNLDQVIAYVLLLDNATAKVKFFLEQHKEVLMVDDVHLKPLRRLRPRRPHYFVRSKRDDCRWVGDWNLMIPEEILNRSWKEVL